MGVDWADEHDAARPPSGCPLLHPPIHRTSPIPRAPRALRDAAVVVELHPGSSCCCHAAKTLTIWTLNREHGIKTSREEGKLTGNGARMQSKQGKRAAAGGAARSPKKKPKSGRNDGQASILNFFGKPRTAAALPKQQDGEVVVVDSDDGHGKMPSCKRDDVIDLDSDAPVEDGDCGGVGSSPEGKPQLACMQLKAESLSTHEEGSDPRKILSDAYDPEVDACWKRGEGAPFLHLARTFTCIDNEKGRYKLRTAVSNMFRSILRLSPEDTLAAVYLTTGKIASAHEGIELNVGGSAVCDAIAEVTGVAKAKVAATYTELGDLGDVAQSFRRSQQLLVQPAPLLVASVFKTMREIASESGQGSTARRKAKMMRLLRGCREQVLRWQKLMCTGDAIT